MKKFHTESLTPPLKQIKIVLGRFTREELEAYLMLKLVGECTPTIDIGSSVVAVIEANEETTIYRDTLTLGSECSERYCKQMDLIMAENN